MTLPYLPGIGDTLRDTLPELGASLGKILNPNAENEQMLRKLVANNPELMDEYVQREIDKPGSLASVFGKRASEYLRSQPLSEQYKQKQEQIKTRTEADKVSLGRNKTGAEADKLQLQQLQDNVKKMIEHNNAVEDMKATDPDLYKRLKKLGTQNKEFGVTQDQLDAMDEASAMREHRTKAREYAKGLAGKNNAELYKMYTDGKISPDQLGMMIDLPEMKSFKDFYERQSHLEDQAFMLRKQQAMLDARERANQAKEDKKLEGEITRNNALASKILSNINTGGKNRKPLSEEAAQSQLSVLNSVLQRISTLTGNTGLTARYTEDPESGFMGIGKKKSVKIYDATGNLVPEFQTIEQPKLPTKPSDNATAGAPSVEDQKLITALKSATPEQIKEFQAQRPQIWARLQQWIK